MVNRYIKLIFCCWFFYGPISQVIKDTLSWQEWQAMTFYFVLTIVHIIHEAPSYAEWKKNK